MHQVASFTLQQKRGSNNKAQLEYKYKALQFVVAELLYYEEKTSSRTHAQNAENVVIATAEKNKCL